jgi:hypothetical protein
MERTVSFFGVEESKEQEVDGKDNSSLRQYVSPKRH